MTWCLSVLVQVSTEIWSTFKIENALWRKLKLPRSWCLSSPSSNCTQSSTMFQTPHSPLLQLWCISLSAPPCGRQTPAHWTTLALDLFLSAVANQRPSSRKREKPAPSSFGSPSCTDAESLVVAIPSVITTPSRVVLLQAVDLSNLQRHGFLSEYLSVFYTSLYIVPAL